MKFLMIHFSLSLSLNHSQDIKIFIIIIKQNINYKKLIVKLNYLKK
jgi:hypothetical protein